MAYSQYNKQTWVDLPSTTTPISAARMQYLEDALATASTQLITLTGQISSLSAGGTVTTPGVDTTAPTINSFAATPGTTPGTVVLAWTSSDNVAVTRSVVTRSGTTRYDGAGTSFTETGLTGGTSYSWTLTVYDAAGNTKTASATATPTSSTTAPTFAKVAIGSPTISGTTITIPWTTTLGTDGVTPDSVTVTRGGSDSNGTGSYSASGLSINGSQPFNLLVPGQVYPFTVQMVKSGANYGIPATINVAVPAATGTTPTLPRQVSGALIYTTTAGTPVYKYEVNTATTGTDASLTTGQKQAFVYVPGGLANDKSKTAKYVMAAHGLGDDPSGFMEQAGITDPLLRLLMDAGYVVIVPQYDATVGNSEAQSRLQRAYNYLLNVGWSFGGVVHFGFSMGGATVLVGMHKNTIAAATTAVLVSPLTNFADAYSAQSAVFNTAYGSTNASTFATATAAWDPARQPASAFAGDRIRINTSTDDGYTFMRPDAVSFLNGIRGTAAQAVDVQVFGGHGTSGQFVNPDQMLSFYETALGSTTTPPATGGGTGGTTTPATPTTLATEKFTGTSGAAWPTQWTTLSGSGGTVTQDGAGRGKLVSSATPYTNGNWALLKTTAIADLDVTLDVTFPVIAEEYLSLELRASAPASATTLPSDSYFLQIFPGNGTNSMGVSVRSGGNETSLSGDIAAGAWTANTARRIRFQAIGSTIAVKVWVPTATEPTTWAWSGSNGVLASTKGSVLVAAASGAAATARTALISNVTVSTGTTAAPVSTGGGAGAGGSTGGGTVASTMPTGDLTGWKYVAGQDFTTNAALGQVGSVYGADVRGYDNFNDTSKNGLYAPDKVLTVANSALTARLHTENGQALVACPIPFGYGGQTYGRYSTRLRVDSGAGYKIAFLLWPSSDSWNDGEVDFPEMDLSAGSTIGGFSHDVNGNPSANAWSMGTNTTLADWHVCTVEWTPTKLTYLVDGVAQSTTTSAAIPKKPMRWTLQCETQLGGGAPAASSVATVYIDWCAQWSYVSG